MASAWPPLSPHQALLSSPSGRRKYQQHLRPGQCSVSPLKNASSTTNLQRSPDHLLRDVELAGQGTSEDEDEETLQLKLAVIEAKLKLKKLQQSKARSQTDSSGLENVPPSGMLSGPGRPSSRTNGRTAWITETEDTIQIPLSPTKRPIATVEQRSPGRVLLGIDKGVKANEISLRRARSLHDRPSPNDKSRRANGARTIQSSHRTTRTPLSVKSTVKSFSERLAETRAQDRTKDQEKANLEKKRRTDFTVTRAEAEGIRLAEEKSRAHERPRLHFKHSSRQYSREDILSAHDQQRAGNLKRSKTNPTDRQLPTSHSKLDSKLDDNDTPEQRSTEGDPTLYEPFSDIHLSTRILPHSFLERSLPKDMFTNLRIPALLKSVHSPAYELPESIVDYVVFGIIASKSSPQTHKPGAGGPNSAETISASNDWEKQWEDGRQNRKKFMVLELTDLTWSVSLYLFDTALPRYHRLSVGTAVAVLNPSIMAPKSGREDTGAFSLTLNSDDDTVLEIGTARDLGFCKAVKKDGKECSHWVDSTKTNYCEYHIGAQHAKIRAGRMGVNTGTSGSGSESLRGRAWKSKPDPARGHEGWVPATQGRGVDKCTGSQYYISGSARGTSSAHRGTPVHHAHPLGLDGDDPFIAEGQLSRDKESRMTQRLATHERERQIVRRLGEMASDGAGREYMRHKSGLQGTRPVHGDQQSVLSRREGILASADLANGNGKRLGEAVRLSPVKKTRLLTEKGIRHPGRESLGPNVDGVAVDDDGLDIV